MPILLFKLLGDLKLYRKYKRMCLVPSHMIKAGKPLQFASDNRMSYYAKEGLEVYSYLLSWPSWLGAY